MKTINNGHLTIAVKEHGAELASIVCNGREYEDKPWMQTLAASESFDASYDIIVE